MHGVRRFIGIAIVTLAACSTRTPSPSVLTPVPAPSFPPLLVLRTVPFSGACASVGLVDAFLAGDPDDPDIAWLTNGRGDSRRAIVFPHGYRARFNPDLEILNAQMQLVLREGQAVTGGCVIGEPGGPLLIGG